MNYKLLLPLTLFSISTISAQTIEEKNEIVKNYDINSSEKLYNEVILKEKIQQEKVLAASKQNKWPIEIYKDGQLIKKAFDVNDKGEPIYTVLYNANAARSTRTDYLHTGGGTGYDLDGENMLIGLWDGGVPLKSHVEFTEGPFSNTSRVTTKDPAADEFHATHVAGTLIARGADPSAKGMAPEAKINAYDFAADQSEVINEAQSGLLISNHSYGVPIFNENGNQQLGSEIPGKYTGESASWDQVHYNFPKYLMVVSAGNEGEDSYSGSLGTNRDKLVGNKTSKNNLVIANAQDAQINNQGQLVDVDINESSSQGPTDDRRIKPDITGNGTGLYSSINQSNQSYGQSTGTSMSSPNVAGSLILLQEFYNRLYGNYMRSATLKGLALHTADDAGKVGPDEVFGWGLLNAKKAAETINGNNQVDDEDKTAFIKELTLTPGQTYSISVSASGTEPLKASITWTDIPGNVANNTINSSTPTLVNDLDIRITKNSDTFLPWKLDFFDPTGPAIKGDNSVDNVERVDVENASGNYTVTVSHKGNLQSGSQKYSLIITGLDGATASVNDLNKNQVSIWPNPADNSVNFTSPNGFTDATIEIYDLNGRIVKTFNDVNASKTFSGDITGMAAGVYVAKLNDGINGTIQKRIIKK